MEPKTQVEIQLGHMCNNRCVFCVSGQQTALGRARPLPLEPILENLDRAYAKGQRKLTLLGGEPTLQPAFKAVVEHAVSLGFEEVVIFTNGVKTARAAYLDEIIALGARSERSSSAWRTGGFFTWRISIQGATKQSHEQTTRKEGSFDRILRTMQHLAERGERITVNMCVVGSNYASVAEFPALIERYNVQQLHLDMVRPMDSGERTEAEFIDMLPSYHALVPPLTQLAQGVPSGFDLNIGNLPYCFAPELARVIHHDGENTETIAVDGEQDLSRPWNKYFVKRRDKFKPPSCAGCVFEPRCSGVFEKYTEIHGTEEIHAVTPERLRALDPKLELFWAHMTPVAEQLRKLRLSGAGNSEVWLHGDRELRLRVPYPQENEELQLALSPPGLGVGSTALFSLQLLQPLSSRRRTMSALQELWSVISVGQEVWHPPGADALPGLSRLLLTRLRRLRQSAPFEGVRWTSLSIEPDARRAVLELEAEDGGRAELWLDEERGRGTGGYRVLGQPTPRLVVGLRAALGCLSKAPGEQAEPTSTAAS